MTQRYASKSALSRRVTSSHVGHGQFGCASCARTAGVCVRVFRCTPVYKRNTAELLQPSHPRTAALSESGGEKASTVFICLGVSVTIEPAQFTSKTEPIGEPPKHRACFSYSGHHMHACMDGCMDRPEGCEEQPTPMCFPFPVDSCTLPEHEHTTSAWVRPPATQPGPPHTASMYISP